MSAAAMEFEAVEQLAAGERLERSELGLAFVETMEIDSPQRSGVGQIAGVVLRLAVKILIQIIKQQSPKTLLLIHFPRCYIES